MSNYANVKARIAANVYTNHDGQVTAENVKTAINEVVETLIAGGYLYAGIAHPGDAEVTPDANVFYIATEPGTYTNFVGAGGPLVVADGEVAVLKYNGTWSKEVTGAATAAQVTELGQKLTGKKAIDGIIGSGLLFEPGSFNNDGTEDDTALENTMRSTNYLRFIDFPASFTLVRNDSGKVINFGYCLYDQDYNFIRKQAAGSALNLQILRNYNFAAVKLYVTSSERIGISDLQKCVFSTANTSVVNFQDSINDRLIRLEGKRLSLDIVNIDSTTFDYMGVRGSHSLQSKTLTIKSSTRYTLYASPFEDCVFAFCKDYNHTSDYMKSKGLLESGKCVVLQSPKDATILYIEGTRFSEVVVVEGETNEKQGYDNYNVKNKIAYSINRSIAYALNVAVPTMFPGYSDITELNGSGEYETRPWASLVFDLAFAVANNIFDEKIVGHTLYEAKMQVVRFVKVLVEWHRANKGAVAYAWGNTQGSLGEGALIAYYIGAAVRLFPEWFDSSTIAKTKTMIEYEADNIVNISTTQESRLYWKYNDGTPVDPQHPGNSPAEEVAWCNAVVGIGAISTDSSTKYAEYIRTFIKLSIIQNSMPGDYESGKKINGYDTAELLGYNLTDDGSVINHDIVHPGYALSYCCSYMGAIAAMIFVGEKIPQAALYNMDKISDCLTKRDYTQAEGYVYPYGTIYKPGTWDIYYPEGNDWGIVLGITQAAFDAIVALLGVHPDESWYTWANLHMNLVLYYQNRFKGGNYYKDDGTENSLGIYTQAYINANNFRTTPEVGSTSFENELYEPTKLLIAYSLLEKFPNLTTTTIVN